MANSTTNVDAIAQSQSGKEVTANAFFDAASQALLFGRRASTSSGLTWGYFGGNFVKSDGTMTQIANGTLALTASTTNYVEAEPTTGAVSSNTTGFTAGSIPLYTVITGASTVTSYTDHRLATPEFTGRLAKTMGDANTTLTQAQSACATLTFTGTLTATRDIVVPLVGKKQWTVYNGTGQSLRFIGASGTGITVATVKHAIVRSDGTNIVRVTADT